MPQEPKVSQTIGFQCPICLCSLRFTHEYGDERPCCPHCSGSQTDDRSEYPPGYLAAGGPVNVTLTITMSGAARRIRFSTREAAMLTAIDWVQAQAQTLFRGTLSMRYARARAWYTGQGGTIDLAPDVGNDEDWT